MWFLWKYGLFAFLGICHQAKGDLISNEFGEENHQVCLEIPKDFGPNLFWGFQARR